MCVRRSAWWLVRSVERAVHDLGQVDRSIRWKLKSVRGVVETLWLVACLYHMNGPSVLTHHYEPLCL